MCEVMDLSQTEKLEKNYGLKRQVENGDKEMVQQCDVEQNTCEKQGEWKVPRIQNTELIRVALGSRKI